MQKTTHSLVEWFFLCNCAIINMQDIKEINMAKYVKKCSLEVGGGRLL